MKGWDSQKIRQGYTKYVGYFSLGSVILLKSAGNERDADICNTLTCYLNVIY